MEQFKIKSEIFGKKSGVVNNAVIEKGSGSYKQFLGHYRGEFKDRFLNGKLLEFNNMKIPNLFD
jgi:hypothetical protein